MDMKQFRAERQRNGDLTICEQVRTRYGYVWRMVCFRHWNWQTGEYE
jgi:hypothetical protein